MDCTYNSNQFKMPLLTVVGIAGISTTFYLAFSVIQSEKEEDFVWVLQNHAQQLPLPPKVVDTDGDLALMKAIDQVFPLASHILCQWHINKCVKARAVTHFAVRGGADHYLISNTVAPAEGQGEDLVAGFFQEWMKVVHSATVLDYRRNIRALKRQYYDRAALLTYLEGTWLIWKDKFISAWVECCMHLGTDVTSRVESSHAVFKRCLEVSLTYITIL
jgi:hypothetical protein